MMRLIPIAVFLTFVLSCQTGVRGYAPPSRAIEVGVTTREQIYRAMGPPLTIHDSRRGTTLVYSRSHSEGMKFGLKAWLMTFSLQSAATRTDSMFIWLSHDDVVLRVRRIPAPENPGWPLWPFGD